MFEIIVVLLLIAIIFILAEAVNRITEVITELRNILREIMKR
jgi:hypothetical protein